MFDPDAADEQLGTIPLTRLLVRELQIPVVSAGGIMDGAGIAACLLLGASAAQLGTAFIGCSESSADAGFRAALLSNAAEHTIMTRTISGRPARCIVNRFTALGDDSVGEIVPAYPIAYDAGKRSMRPPKPPENMATEPSGPARLRHSRGRCRRQLWSQSSNPSWSKRSPERANARSSGRSTRLPVVVAREADSSVAAVEVAHRWPAELLEAIGIGSLDTIQATVVVHVGFAVIGAACPEAEERRIVAEGHATWESNPG